MKRNRRLLNLKTIHDPYIVDDEELCKGCRYVLQLQLLAFLQNNLLHYAVVGRQLGSTSKIVRCCEIVRTFTRILKHNSKNNVTGKGKRVSIYHC